MTKITEKTDETWDLSETNLYAHGVSPWQFINETLLNEKEYNANNNASLILSRIHSFMSKHQITDCKIYIDSTYGDDVAIKAEYMRKRTDEEVIAELESRARAKAKLAKKKKQTLRERRLAMYKKLKKEFESEE